MAANPGHREKMMKRESRQLRCGFTEGCSGSAGQTEEQSILQELGTRKLLTLINERKLRYVGHALRNQDTDLMKTIFQGKTEAKRKKGRPAASLIGNITESCGMRIQEVSRSIEDRSKWRGKIKSSSRGAAANTALGDADQ